MNNILIQDINYVLDEIITISDYFYQQKYNDGYSALDQVIDHLIKITDSIFAYKKTEGLAFDENKWMQSFTMAMKAIEEKDGVLLADLLSLEIAKQLEDVLRRII